MLVISLIGIAFSTTVITLVSIDESTRSVIVKVNKEPLVILPWHFGGFKNLSSSDGNA